MNMTTAPTDHTPHFVKKEAEEGGGDGGGVSSYLKKSYKNKAYSASIHRAPRRHPR